MTSILNQRLKSLNLAWRNQTSLIFLVGVVMGVSGCLPENATVSPVSDLAICGRSQPNTSDKTCIVDGDTLWLNGVNLRLRNFDTPESRSNICGGSTETDLANKATMRLQELLNTNNWTIETFGIDGTGSRRLATIDIDGRDVGEFLIEEKLARRWPDGDEFWCQ
jgi:endonuclease YncB( thermonuclease family)